MKNKQIFRPRSSAFALEPRVLFDGAAAVAVEDHLSAGDPLAHQVDAAEIRPASTVEAPAAVAAPSASPSTLLVIDSRVADYQSLQSDLPGNVMVRIISADESGIAALDAAINSSSNIQSIQIISHGSSGSISLGSDTINSSTLSSSSAQIQSWAPHLTADADILLYGCDIAAGPNGTAFLNQLAALTGADIAASTNATGSAARGGDWVLEQQIGSIDSRLAVSEAALARYDGLFAAPAIGGTVADQTVNDKAAITPFSTVTITDADLADIQRLRVALDAAEKGSLSNLSGGLYDADTGLYTFTGSAAAAQAAIRGLVFTPTANHVAPGVTEKTTFTISVYDYTSTVTDHSSTVIATSVNDAPVAVVDTVSIAEDQVSVAGNILSNDTDVDTGDSKTVSVLTGGTVGSVLSSTYGSLLLSSDGSYIYTLDNGNSAVQALGAGQSLTEEFHYTMKDTASATSSSTFIVTISGTNDAPVAVTDTISIVEDQFSVDGNILSNDTDVDTGDSKTVSALAGGTIGSALTTTYGSLIFNADGSYTYTLDNSNPLVQALGVDQPLVETFTYTVKDTANETSSSTLTVTINGTNDQPVLTPSGVSLAQTEDLTTAFTVTNLLTNASAKAIWSDTDAGTVMGIAIISAPGTDAASSMTGTWEYQLSGGAWTPFPVVSADSALLLPGDAQLRYVVTANNQIDSRNSGTVSLSYKAWDASSGLAGATGITTVLSSTSPFSSAANTATLNVTPVNDPPAFSASPLVVNEHASVMLTGGFTNDSTQVAGLTGNMRIYDPDNSITQILYRIEELPANGTLTLNGAVLGVGSLFSQANINSITYTPTVGELTDDTTDRFYFTIRDGAGGIIGSDGKNTGSNPWASLDITIKDVNAQVAVSGTTLAIAEDNANPGVSVIAAIPLSMIDADDPDGLRTLTITSLPGATFGTLQYWNSTNLSYQAATTGLSFTQAQLSDSVHPALRFVYNNSIEPTDQNGTVISAESQTSFNVSISDNNDHLTPTTANAAVNIAITPINDAPLLVTNDLIVLQGSGNNSITATNLTTTDPDSPASQRTYTVSVDPTRGYLTLDGVRIGRGSTFSESDLSSGVLKYTCNDAYYHGSDSLQVVATDGHGADSGVTTLAIKITTDNTVPLSVFSITIGSDTASITGTLKGVSPEGLFLTFDQRMLSDDGTGSSFTLTAPMHGRVYLNGVELVYGASGTAFTQADINSGRIIYIHDSSESSAYSFTDTLNITAAKGAAAIAHSFTITITPVDDAPTISQTNAGPISTNQDGGTLMEQHVDNSNGMAAANFALTGIVNAVKLTTDNFQWHDIDNTQSQLTYMASTVGGTIGRWNGSIWSVVTSLSADDLAAGNIAYFHNPAADVAAPDNTTMTGSVTVYLIDGGVVAAGDVLITPPNISEKNTLAVNDGTTSLSLTKNSQMRSPDRTVTFTIADINDAPVAINTSFTVTEFSSGIPGQTSHIQVLTTALVAASDSDTGNVTWTYTLTELPTNGTIQQWDGSAWNILAINAIFTYADLNTGNLRYVNAGRIEVTSGYDWNIAHDGFKFTVNDGELISLTKPLTSNAATVSIFLSPTNQPPLVVNNGPGSVPEGGALKITSNLLGSADVANSVDIVKAIDPDNTRVQVQYRITDNVDHGYLYLGDPATGAITKQLSVGSAFTLEDIQSGKLWYQHNGTEAALYSSQDTFTYAISDASGMTEPTEIFVINIKPVNDAPVVTGLAGGATFTEGDTSSSPNVSPVLIDTSVTLGDSDLANNSADFRGGSLTISDTFGTKTSDQLSIKNIGIGSGQIGYDTLTGIVTYGGVQIGTVTTGGLANGVNGNDLTINFTAGANTSLTVSAVKALIEAITFSHTEYDNAITGTRTLNYILMDGGGMSDPADPLYTDSRDVYFPGADTWSGSATVTVTAANDRPVLTDFDAGNAISLGSPIDEDNTNPAGHLVSSFLTTAVDSTHSGITDVDTGAEQGIAVTSVSNASTGHWEYSADGSTNWTPFGSVSETSALLLAPTYSVRFVPDTKDGGTFTFTYKAWDQTSGTVGSKISTTSTAQTSAFSIGTDSVNIVVMPKNDAPTLIGINSGSVTAVEDTVFGFTGSNRITLGDVDAGDRLIKLTLTFAGSGSFGFSSATGSVYTDAGGTTPQGLWSGFTDSQTLTLYGTSSNLNTVVGKLQYTPDADANNFNLAHQSSTAQPSVKLDVDDLGYGENNTPGSPLTATKTVTVNISAVNDSPSVTIDSTPISLIENAGATPILNDIVLTDTKDSFDTNYATSGTSLPYLVITTHNGFLTFAGAPGVTTVSGDGSGTLTLQGTLVDISAALSSGKHYLSYTPYNNFSGIDTLMLTLHDNGNSGSGGNKTDVKNIAITVEGDNAAPSFSGLGGGSPDHAYTENGDAIILDANATVSDPELSVYDNWGNAVLTLVRNGVAQSEDVFGVTGSGNTGVNFSSADTLRIGTTTVGSFINSGGQLQITFASGASTVQVNQVLQAITYVNTSNDPATDITINYSIDDGNTNSGINPQGTSSPLRLTSTGSVRIGITAVNDAPIFTMTSGNAAFTENALTPTTIDSGLSLADFDDTQLTGAKVSISGNFVSGDVLAIAGTGIGYTVAGTNIHIESYDNLTGVLLLSGADTVANYQAVLRTVTFTNPSDDPTANTTAGTRTITFAATDSNSKEVGSGALTGSATRAITVTPTQDAPVLTGGGQTLLYIENGLAAVIDATVNVLSDDDDTHMGGATVTLSSGYTSGDTLSFTAQNGISILSNAGGVLTLTGNATLAQYTAALQSVKYSSTSDDPTVGSASRTVTWRVTDANSDNAGAAASNTCTSNINITPVNDAPTLTATGLNPTFTEASGVNVQAAAIAVFSGANAGTVESGQKLTGMTFTVSGLQDGVNESIVVDGETITLAADSSGTTVTNEMNYAVTLSGGTATVVLTKIAGLSTTNMNSLINAITYQNTRHDDPTSGPRVFTITQVRDNGGTSDGGIDSTALALTSTVSVVKVNDSPSLTATVSSPLVTESVIPGTGVPAVTLLSGSAVNDVDFVNASFGGGSITVSLAVYRAGDILDLASDVTEAANAVRLSLTNVQWHNGTSWVTVGTVASTANGGGKNLVINLNANATETNLGYVLNALRYRSTSDDPTAVVTTRSYSIKINDGNNNALAGGPSTLDSNTLSGFITIIPVNDAPTLTATRLNPTFTEAAGLGTQASAVAVFSGASTGIVESNQTITGMTFTVSGLQDGVNESIVVDGKTITLGGNSSSTTTTTGMNYAVTLADGTATVVLTKSTGVSTTSMNTLVNGIRYQNTNLDNPTAGNRVFTLTQVKDSGGGSNGGVDTTTIAIASTVNVVKVNDAPTLTATGSNPSFTEAVGLGTQAAPVNLFSNASVGTIESGQTITGLTFTVSGLQDGVNESIVVDGTTITLGDTSFGTSTSNSMGYTATVTGSTATVVLTSAGVTPANASNLISGITYQNTKLDDPTAGNRVFTLTQIKDNGGTSPGTDTTTVAIVSTVNVASQNDEPVLTASGSSPLVTENVVPGTGVPAVTLLSGCAVSDVDFVNASFGGGTITVSLDVYIAGDLLDLPSGVLAVANAVQLSGPDVQWHDGTSWVTVGRMDSTAPGTDKNLVINLNANATETNLGYVLNALSYRSISDDPTIVSTTRSYSIKVNDGNNNALAGGPSALDSNTLSGTITITPVNDAPTLTATGSNPTFTEAAGLGTQAPAVALFSGARTGTVESGQTITGMTFTVGGLQDGANESIFLDGETIMLGGISSGTTTTNGMNYAVTIVSGTATVVLTSSAGVSTTNLDTLINEITYQNTRLDDPTAGNRVFTIIQVKDNGGISSGGVDTTTVAIASTVNVVKVNDAPTLTATGSNPTFTEAAGLGTQAPAVALFSGASTGTVESGQTITDMTFTVSGLQDGGNESIVVDGKTITFAADSSGTTVTNGMDYAVTLSSGTATVVLTSAGVSTTNMNTLINAITYQNTNLDDPTAGNRVFTLTQVKDNGGILNSGVDTTTVAIASTVNVVKVNDAPVVGVTDVTGAVSEMVTPSGNLSDSGTIIFADVDLTDSHSISAVTSSDGSLGSLVARISTDTTGTGVGGVITWNYSVPASAVEYLVESETKVEQFTLKIDDGQGGVVDRTITVTITGTNAAPVAVNDSRHSPDGRPVTVAILGNDSDPEGDTVIVSRIAGIAVAPGGTVTIPEGTVTLNPAGTLTFAPNPGVQGNVEFSYEISDGNGGTAAAQVNISIVPEPNIFPSGPSQKPQLYDDYNKMRPPGDQSVVFYGDAYNSLSRQPIPFSPALFVNQVVELAQQERMNGDTLSFSNPEMVRHGEIESPSIGAELGLDSALFVQHAVRDSQAQGESIDDIVNGRLTRTSLSSDWLIPTPGIHQPDPQEIVPPSRFAGMNDILEHDVLADQHMESAPPVTRLNDGLPHDTSWAAPSFSEQIRAVGGYGPIAASGALHQRSNLKQY